MRNYVITCESGTEALVRAENEAEAVAEWTTEVAKSSAEPMLAIRKASQADIKRCRELGHDYR